MTADESNEAAEARYLLTPKAIRERAEALYAHALAGRLEHFTVDERALESVAERVLQVTLAEYPEPSKIPYHARWRHFSVGGVDRPAELTERLSTASAEERLRAEFELAITSVLLDAGAGEAWAFLENGQEYRRSEGLAVASYHLFASGGLSANPAKAPLSVDARVLSRFDGAALARAFQVSDSNPLVGLDGRAGILARLGRSVLAKPAYFGREPRLGELGVYLARRAGPNGLPARELLTTILDAFGDIWPGRESLAGKNLGDVWHHALVGRVPLHKLSQWLSYSLCEPLEAYGVRIVDLDELTGLAEYRNGGLFVDGGVLVPKHDGVLCNAHPVSSSVVVEWRGLTIALLDRTAQAVRSRLGLSAVELPLAKVLEGGTWRTGRVLAAEKRPSGAPPIQIVSDGTVF